ncbi:MAG: hypothetical protein EOO20_18460 [Chryseobacterium sp.]|nr:MAG: hypothetical protein EOO20_18460 [Chryseobacterium sp.]
MSKISEIKEIAMEINECLTKHDLLYKPTFDHFDLNMSGNIITNHNATCKLSDIIFKNYFFQEPLTQYHHFTRLEFFDSIITQKELWLFSIKKRFGEGEFKPFYDAHNMDGYSLRKNAAGIAMEDELVDNAFYISFTGDSLPEYDEKDMWSCFAGKDGVRLVFEVSNVNTHLRSIHYPSPKSETYLPLLKDLIAIAAKRDKMMIIKGTATIGFFYLRKDLHYEQECRLLVKRDIGEFYQMTFGKNKDGYEYMRFPIDSENPIAKFKLKKVIVRNEQDLEAIKHKLNLSNAYRNLEIELRNL